jgi:hypothetical protein
MIQCGGSFGFALKTGECLLVLGYVVGQELEGDKAAEFNILSFLDHSYTAAAQLLNDAVMRDGLADHERRKDSARNLRVEQSRSQRGQLTDGLRANPVISGLPSHCLPLRPKKGFFRRSCKWMNLMP